MELQVKLPDGYECVELTSQEFQPLWNHHAPMIFDENSQIFRAHQFLSQEEKSKTDLLRLGLASLYSLNLAIYYKGEFVAWCSGNQETTESFYMRNSAVLPEHRRKGLYTFMLKSALGILQEKGFQKVYSRHSATNNSVIIPKLMAGFVITSLEVNDAFGVLVHLTFYQKELRRKMLRYRVGEIKPDLEIKDCLKIL
ncbi:MAG: GNAT family N-acetyltransferase [Pseudomonadota bacterium]